MSTLTAKIQLRRDTSANWTTNNPILLAGEVAFTSDVFYTGTDQQRFKIGDGVQTWSQLDYVPEGGATAYPENLFLTVVNKTTDNLLASEYKVLKVITAQGGRLAVDYALADSDANSADTIGVVYENINNNQEGRIITIGEITGINTTGNLQGETWADGDSLFLSDIIDGGITNVRPTAPNHGVRLGYVVNVNANNGKIYVKIDNGYELSEIHDIYAPTPTNNDGIFWSSGTTRYENKSIATVLGYTPENSANKGVANGYAPLASDAKVDAAYLPAYVDEVLEYANLAAFPATGASDKIYIALDTNKVYRWSGSVYIEVAANSGVWGAITGTITNQTDLQHALNQKYNVYFASSSTTNPADATIYYLSFNFEALALTDTVRQFSFDRTETLKEISLTVLQSTTGSNETVNVYLRNITTNTDYSLGTFTSNFGSNRSKTFLFTGLNITVNSTDNWSFKILTPTWVTNPTSWRVGIRAKTN
jgi:hypothetical protein